MANTSISDVADAIELGENRRDTGTLDAAANAGQLMKETATGFDLNDLVNGARGVLRDRYDTDIDTQIAINTEVEVTTRGYVAAYCVDPTGAKQRGSLLWPSLATPGSLVWAAEALGEPIAELVEPAANGDTVVVVKLLKGT